MREQALSVCSRSPFPHSGGGYFIETQKKYGIIYADPPWRYQQKSLSGAAEHHYSTMSVEEICQLDVASVAADDCVLFLWATFPQLQEALQVIKAWDFKYKTVAFVWLKQNKSGKGFLVWASGQGAMLNSACLPQGESPAGNPTESISLSSALCVSTARNPVKPEKKSSSLWESCHGWSCLPVRKPTDGTLGEMKSHVMLK